MSSHFQLCKCSFIKATYGDVVVFFFFEKEL